MKIIELIIDELDRISGFDAVALVEEPAIEADFFAFKADDLHDLIEFELIKIMMKEEFESITIGGKPLFDTIEEAERVAKELGCEGHHVHSVDGVDWYMPCEKHSDLTDEVLEDYEDENSAETFSLTRRDDAYSFALNVEQKVLVGPLMVPDKLIVRLDAQNEPYYVYFSKDTVKKTCKGVYARDLDNRRFK